MGLNARRATVGRPGRTSVVRRPSSEGSGTGGDGPRRRARRPFVSDGQTGPVPRCCPARRTSACSTHHATLPERHRTRDERRTVSPTGFGRLRGPVRRGQGPRGSGPPEVDRATQRVGTRPPARRRGSRTCADMHGTQNHPDTTAVGLRCPRGRRSVRRASAGARSKKTAARDGPSPSLLPRRPRATPLPPYELVCRSQPAPRSSPPMVPTRRHRPSPSDPPGGHQRHLRATRPRRNQWRGGGQRRSTPMPRTGWSGGGSRPMPRAPVEHGTATYGRRRRPWSAPGARAPHRSVDACPVPPTEVIATGVATFDPGGAHAAPGRPRLPGGGARASCGYPATAPADRRTRDPTRSNLHGGPRDRDRRPAARCRTDAWRHADRAVRRDPDHRHRTSRRRPARRRSETRSRPDATGPGASAAPPWIPRRTRPGCWRGRGSMLLRHAGSGGSVFRNAGSRRSWRRGSHRRARSTPTFHVERQNRGRRSGTPTFRGKRSSIGWARTRRWTPASTRSGSSPSGRSAAAGQRSP